MRRDNLYLADIVEASDAIAGFISGTDEADFVGNDLVRSAVLQKLTVIGEAAARISDALKRQHSALPWRDIVAFRNIACIDTSASIGTSSGTPRRSMFPVCMKRS